MAEQTDEEQRAHDEFHNRPPRQRPSFDAQEWQARMAIKFTLFAAGILFAFGFVVGLLVGILHP